MQEYLNLLGNTVKDKVTGMVGMVESISFDAYGCVQTVVRQKVKKDGAIPDGRWMDAKRLEVLPSQRILPAPNFVMDAPVPEMKKPGDEKGPADKPVPGN